MMVRKSCPTCGRILEIEAPGWVRCSGCATVVTAAADESAASDPAGAEAAWGGGALPPDEASAETSPEVVLPSDDAPSFVLSDEPASQPSGPDLDEITLPPTHQPGALCARHIENPAEALCERCGDYMCRICAVPIEGRLYCPGCFDTLYQRGAFYFSRQQFTQPKVALALGISSLTTSLACCLLNLLASIPCGIAGIVVGLSARKQLAARPELGGAGTNTAGMVLSGVGLLLSGLEIVYWIFVFSRR